MTVLDRRLHAYRDDLADLRLKGQVEAQAFYEGELAHVRSSIIDIRREPRPDSGVDTQILRGQDLRVFHDAGDGFLWVQSLSDGYVGYIAETGTGDGAFGATHVVSATRTFIYPAADLKLSPVEVLSMGALLDITHFEERRGTNYALLSSGEAVIARHVRPRDEHAADYVAVAESLVNTPYLWGGASAFGIDCSGLVQLSMRMTGTSVLRDSDMQAASIGTAVDPRDGLRRGDLVFWKGHVAIMTDPNTIIHANGHTMSVSIERLAEAVARIGYLYGQPTGYRRP